ncbi:substrate-binding domain-containing protein [Vibrio breoganii]|uniref:substrate-binding domain-containing protein n=1 Tax=Vibrio breoganii TaxID=553239 RepID=UPI000C85F5C3|nr:substrate-binding domain-containing protein [Vibrio breoganii]PMI18563.1 transcriptional regulator [Vibrio breoganii]PMK30819.1 transcriptional regulator [Vibrio breoganii]PMK40145.1 transcriptional regulator [Vibrio breoganii]
MTQDKKSRPSLKDVADQVGVTKMTVSRFLRSPDLVSEQTRNKIAKVIEDIGYIHNRAPSMLSKSSSKAIGVLLPSLSNQVFANFTQGIEFVTNNRGYEVLISHYGYNEEIEEKKIATLLSYHIDGIILTGTYHTKKTLQMLKTANIPVVEAMELTENPIDMVVGLDHEVASYAAVKAMLDSGRKNIGYFGARLDNRTKLRMQGYDRAIVENGAHKYHFLTHKRSCFTLGRELLDRALIECPELDGVFCTNDDIAIGTILACSERNIRVPEDISIIGYNALDIGQAITPKLSSVYTPRYEIGEKSASILLDKIEGKPNIKAIYDLGYTLTKGESFIG